MTTATEFSTLQLLPGIDPDGEASADWLRSIHRELVDAFADAQRIRRVDQLLDVGGTLTTLADAVRIDWSDTSRLVGQPRDGARVPVLLKELELKLAGLAALGGPELAVATRLTEMAASPSRIDDEVFDAMDEIKAALLGGPTGPPVRPA